MRPVDALRGTAELAASLQVVLQMPSLEGIEEVGSQLAVCCTAMGEVQDAQQQMAAAWGLELAACALSDGRGFLVQASSCCLSFLWSVKSMVVSAELRPYHLRSWPRPCLQQVLCLADAWSLCRLLRSLKPAGRT